MRGVLEVIGIALIVIGIAATILFVGSVFCAMILLILGVRP